jgi:hypothetical protein
MEVALPLGIDHLQTVTLHYEFARTGSDQLRRCSH